MYYAELARSGKPLFFIRGLYIYVAVFGAAIIAYLTRDLGPFQDAGLDKAWFWVSLFVATLGALIRVKTSAHAANGTSGRPKVQAVAAELNTTGPYSLVRNPLYVGRILNYTGMAMLSGSWEFGLFTYLASVLIYERVAVYEENFLRGKFGNAHEDWSARVPFLWPKLTGWVKPKYDWWTRRMIYREQHKIFLLIACVFLTWFGRLGFDINAVPADQMIYVQGFVAVIVIRLAIGLGATLGLFKGIE